jgi:hypothetical protein
MARSGAASARWMLHVFGKSMHKPMMSSIYISCMPFSLMSKLTTSSLPCSKGMLSSNIWGFGTKYCDGEWSVVGSQVSSWAIAVARSAMVSNMMLHSNGHAAPPKVRLSIISASYSGFVMKVASAISRFEVCFSCKDAGIWEFSSGCDSPID